ncbi:hypothetical protein PVAP13_3NG208508 [Panicum virgatum]|uniref:Uncharacterized protein n=1 Tax=Panicum virgatum TaxID=38727 RepID=A0A8T0TWZ9_PANVG|nr:hypothetical protein PVAP13_3NG208508 [Panicum virgatum]
MPTCCWTVEAHARRSRAGGPTPCTVVTPPHAALKRLRRAVSRPARILTPLSRAPCPGHRVLTRPHAASPGRRRMRPLLRHGDHGRANRHLRPTTGDAFPFVLVALDADGALSDAAAAAAPERARHWKCICLPRWWLRHPSGRATGRAGVG